jgi:hypothetical protein
MEPQAGVSEALKSLTSLVKLKFGVDQLLTFHQAALTYVRGLPPSQWQQDSPTLAELMSTVAVLWVRRPSFNAFEITES